MDTQKAIETLKFDNNSWKKYAKWVGYAILVYIVMSFNFGINDAGHRTVIQYPWGTLNVKFTPGIYVKFFGKTENYKDVITYDFDKTEAKGEASLDNPGIKVRYQDGGTGTIYGKARFSLPNDDETMLALHKAFRSDEAVAYKLIKTVTEESQNMTAGLMSSEEAYAAKRGQFSQWAHMQLSDGKFVTEIKAVTVAEEATGKKVDRDIPVIKYGTDGFPMHNISDLKTYGITVSGFQITDWDFEAKTLEQISTKREATMGIITAKANAERAKQEALTAEEQGKKNVMVDKYSQEQKKAQAVVVAQQEKEVAEIAAQQKVAVAEQAKLEAEQKKNAAVFTKQEQILLGEGEAERKKLVMGADGALTQKLAAFVEVQKAYAEQIGKQRWVPEIQMGGSQNTSGSSAADLVTLLTAKTAKELNLDVTLPAQTSTKQ